MRMDLTSGRNQSISITRQKWNLGGDNRDGRNYRGIGKERG